MWSPYHVDQGLTVSPAPGVAFPTCISLNNVVCHHCPLESDPVVTLKDGDVVKMYVAVKGVGEGGGEGQAVALRRMGSAMSLRIHPHSPFTFTFFLNQAISACILVDTLPQWPLPSSWAHQRYLLSLSLSLCVCVSMDGWNTV